MWLINGLFCKLLNFVPRHQEIVSKILGNDYSLFFTKTIGILEVLMFVWIVSKIKSKWCAVLQMITIATMNIIEFFAVPDLLLYGRLNIVFAAIFIAVIYTHQFVISKSKS